ncbi:hypothetical protein RRG08_033298 [Elysia crispata]|uniref:Uncharacterized protein n=1 Tax=Elysia crispata TaxID=231223 RepID=A0AAE0XR84_9GAST|nr:hypothetical protein RRG08_033298 [Elysia crispata]
MFTSTANALTIRKRREKTNSTQAERIESTSLVLSLTYLGHSGGQNHGPAHWPVPVILGRRRTLGGQKVVKLCPNSGTSVCVSCH